MSLAELSRIKENYERDKKRWSENKIELQKSLESKEQARRYATRHAKKEALLCQICLDESLQIVLDCGHAPTCQKCFKKW